MLRDQCILVDPLDRIVGGASKLDAHRCVFWAEGARKRGRGGARWRQHVGALQSAIRSRAKGEGDERKGTEERVAWGSAREVARRTAWEGALLER